MLFGIIFFFMIFSFGFSESNFLFALGINILIWPLFMYKYLECFNIKEYWWYLITGHYEKLHLSCIERISLKEDMRKEAFTLVLGEFIVYILITLFAMVVSGIISYLVTLESTSVTTYVLSSVICNIFVFLINYVQER